MLGAMGAHGQRLRGMGGIWLDPWYVSTHNPARELMSSQSRRSRSLSAWR